MASIRDERNDEEAVHGRGADSVANAELRKPKETNDAIIFPFSGFTYRKSSGQTNRTTVGKGFVPPVPILTGIDLASRSSLPDPPSRRSMTSSNYEDERRMKRRILATGIIIMAIIVAIVAAIVTSQGGGDGDSDSNVDNSVKEATYEVGEQVTFYVVANVPFSDDEEDKLQNELMSISNDAEFVVHLGNIHKASESQCKDSSYQRASSILQKSAAPLLLIPGNNDWNDCPHPQQAWLSWQKYFGRFEDMFTHDFVVDRQLGREENFAFLQGGILFLGIHLVPGKVQHLKEWNTRHVENIRWTEKKMNEYAANAFRAVVIFGHASPTFYKTQDYFWGILDEVKEVGKPVLYMHANEPSDGSWREYQPFSDTSMFTAVQVEEGGSSEPVRVTVKFGSNPFIFDRGD